MSGGQADRAVSVTDTAERVALVDLLDRVLDHGVVVAGDLTLSLADVDLVYVGLRLLVCAPDKMSASAPISKV